MVLIFYIYLLLRVEWLHFTASKFKMMTMSTTHRNVCGPSDRVICSVKGVQNAPMELFKVLM